MIAISGEIEKYGNEKVQKIVGGNAVRREVDVALSVVEETSVARKNKENRHIFQVYRVISMCFIFVHVTESGRRESN